jgi:hypothetical protein
MGASRDRDAKDKIFVSALVGGANVLAACEAAGISQSTGRRRLKDPEFADRVTEARETQVAEVVRRLKGAAVSAADTLVKGLAAEREVDRQRAARSILHEVWRIQEHDGKLGSTTAVLGTSLRSGDVRPSDAELAGDVLQGLLAKAAEALQAGDMATPTFGDAIRFVSLYADLRGDPNPEDRMTAQRAFIRLLDLVKETLSEEEFEALGRRIANDAVMRRIERG